MVNAELLRIVDSISRDKNIEKDLIFEDIESAMVSAVRKEFGQIEDVAVKIDRMTGEFSAIMDGETVSIAELGRIAAQTAKQVIIQKIREAERGSIFEEFSKLKGQLISGTVAREERGALLVTLQGRGEGFLPRSEQIPGETHHPGERIRAMILDVREAPHQVKIVLSRTHPDLIKRLFELEVPEVAERVIELKAMAREAGYRTKVAVSSIDSRVDAVGACVGVRGSRIKNIVEELGGEKIDIVRWNESSQILIGNALKPAEIQDIALCFELGRASVVVGEDQLSLAIGKRGQNVRLAARLTGWDIDIVTPAEYNKNLEEMDKTLKSISDIDDVFLAKLTAMGIVSLMDIDEIGADPLMQELELTEERAKEIVAKSSVRAKELSIEIQAAKEQAAKERAEAAAAAAKAEAEGIEAPEDESADGASADGETAVAVTDEATDASDDTEAPEVTDVPEDEAESIEAEASDVNT
jgi:N utilization substance protein A